MFERAHHRRIASVLERLDGQGLDGQVLAESECWFGGGTAMALRYGEYRESVDIDFLVSKRDGYRQLRELLTGPGGDLGRAIQMLKDRPQRLDQCMTALSMDRTPKALLWSRIRDLGKRGGL